MTRRRLSPEEIDLWRRVAERADRLHPDTPVRPQPAAQKPNPQPARPVRAFDPFHVGQKSAARPAGHVLQPALKDRLAASPVQMDRKNFTRMKRGKLQPEARIDLHGMTLDRAHPSLVRFILSAQAAGKRLVLVITGKGRIPQDHGPIPTPRGILRHQVPNWLNAPPLSQAVLQVSEAHFSHGGGGAYYVYLRKPR